MAQLSVNFSPAAGKKPPRHIASHIRAANTFGEVLRVVEVDLAKAAVSLHQVVLGGAQIDLTVLETKHAKHLIGDFDGGPAPLFDNYNEHKSLILS